MQDKEEKPVLVVLPAEVVQDRSQLVPEVGSTQWPAQLMLLGSGHCTSSSLRAQLLLRARLCVTRGTALGASQQQNKSRAGA